jgi:hypothetical protein
MRQEFPEQDEQKNEDKPEERFESDTQKIVRRHLENEDDVITEEDIRNVRVGMMPPLEETMTKEEADRQFDELGETLEDKPENNKPITPWDVKDE